MFVRQGKTIEVTHKTKVVGEEVAVEITQIVEVVEEATTINLVVRLIIEIRVTFNVTIAKNMECKNPRRKRKYEANLAQGHIDDEPALLIAVLHNSEPKDEIFLNEEKVNPIFKPDDKEQNRSKIWYLDNGTSNHMTGDKDNFSELNRSVQGYVKFGDGSKVRVEGKGSIIFRCKNGEQRMLQGVYYKPQRCNNIISLGQLAQNGDWIIIHGLFLWIYDKRDKLLMKVQQPKNRLYKIWLNDIAAKSLVIEVTHPKIERKSNEGKSSLGMSAECGKENDGPKSYELLDQIQV